MNNFENITKLKKATIMGSKFFGNKLEQPTKKKDKRTSNNSNSKRQSSVKKSGRGR